MTSAYTSRVGGVLSADIAFPNFDGAVRFYSRVLTSGETPLWRQDLMNAHGVPVIGLGSRSGEYANLPLQWMPHIQVADVAHSVELAIEQGGHQILHSKNDEASQWAVLLDPNEAAFGLIPVVSGDEVESAGQVTSTGHITWLDLTVTNAPATCDFYTRVVGWLVQEVAMEDEDGRYTDYCMACGDGSPVAGVCHARGLNIGLPPVWLIYLPVGDLAESLHRVEQEGGQIIYHAQDKDRGYSYAVIRDPAGAYLALHHHAKE